MAEEVHTAGSECTLAGSEITGIDGAAAHRPLPCTTGLTGPHQHLAVTDTVTCAPPDGDHRGGHGDGYNGSGGKRGSGGGGR